MESFLVFMGPLLMYISCQTLLAGRFCLLAPSFSAGGLKSLKANFDPQYNARRKQGRRARVDGLTYMLKYKNSEQMSIIWKVFWCSLDLCLCVCRVKLYSPASFVYSPLRFLA